MYAPAPLSLSLYIYIYIYIYMNISVISCQRPRTMGVDDSHIDYMRNFIYIYGTDSFDSLSLSLSFSLSGYGLKDLPF